jgi:zinc protease
VIMRSLAVAGVAVAFAVPFAVGAQGFDRTRPPTLPAPAALTVPAVKTARLANGAALRVVEHRELPLVQLTLQVGGGARLDRDMPGLASFTAGMLDEGAGTRDANALQAELAFLGAALSTSADWDNTTISLKVSRRNFEAALDLMADIALRPAFASAEVRRQRDLRLAGLLQQKDQARSLASLAFNQTMFPAGHPYHNSLGGDSVSTAKLDSATVRQFYAATFRPQRASFTVVGDLTEADARRLLDARFNARTWRVSGPERTPAPVLVQAARPAGTKVYLVDKPNAAQSVIYIGAPGVERTHNDFAAIQVMNTILGGSFSSRLMTNLRETKGYTYGASSGFTWRPLPGPFVASSDVRTDVTDSSLVEFFRELRMIRDSAVSDVELERAKAYLKLGLPGDLESTSQIAGQVTSLATYNLPLTWLQEYAEQVGRVTAADVRRVARQFVPADSSMIVIVGDLAKVRAGIEALRLGPSTVLEVNAIAKE